MNADELLLQDQLCQVPDQVSQKRDSLQTVVLSGRGKMFLGGNYTPEQIQQMNTEEINQLYNKYQSAFGGRMAKSLSKSIINLYTKLVKVWLPVESEDELKSSLETDPVISNSIGDLASKLYGQFGCYLAPIITVVITANNLNFDFYKNGDHEEDTSDKPNHESCNSD